MFKVEGTPTYIQPYVCLLCVYGFRVLIALIPTLLHNTTQHHLSSLIRPLLSALLCAFVCLSHSSNSLMASLGILFLHLFFFHLLLPASHEVYIAYNTSSGPVPNKLNVHLVPHTHDDIGWLKTVDEYYVGANNSIQVAAVELILNTVVSALQEDPNRKFVYVEQGYFQRWWRDQSTAKQGVVKELVEAGQLEFINGGWCMHDEATTHYIDMIDQTTFGNRFIKQQFGKSPRIGWQIDPFGHSSVQAYLLGAELGFDALYFARIDYQDMSNRINETLLEFVWQGSRSLGSSAQIFTGVLFGGYGSPPGFDFDTDGVDIPIQDDPLLFDYNVKDRVDAFVKAAQDQAKHYRTNHIMFTMGDDFAYQNAWSWYREMDRFIHYVNLDERINVFYSTPSAYTDAKYAANETWPLKTADFFPYADNADSYWTGYFTSRPALKGYVRMLSGYYLVARQLEFLVGRKFSGPNTDSLGEALATLQHHDAVSGTEKQHVADDYAKRLAIGAAEAAEVVNSALTCLVSLNSTSKCMTSVKTFEQCLLLNISYCPPSESFHSSNETLVVIVYNPIGWSRTDFIRIPINAQQVVVTDAEGKVVPSQILPLDNVTEELRNFYVQANLGVTSDSSPHFWLIFKVSVPPFGFNSYFISKATEVSASNSSVEIPSGNGTVLVGSGDLKLTFSVETGLLTRMTNNQTGVDILIEQSYLWYDGYYNNGEQASGAYIFRPDGVTPTPVARKVPLIIWRGPLLDEVHQQFNPWVYQVTRVYKDMGHTETEFQIGPIPIGDGIGKEVITRMTTGILSNATFYTDSNGRDFLKRVKNHRSDWNLTVTQPIAGNYYPINLGIYIKDSDIEFSILVDRPVGGSSIKDGQLELMLHRRLLHDDGRGVGEALNETVCVGLDCRGLTVRGKYFTSINLANDGSRWRRSVGQKIYSPLQLAFANQDTRESWQSSHSSSFQAMAPGYTLPENVALITLQDLDDKSVLLRLAHLFEVDEDEELSTMASVNLQNLFADQKIRSATELSLSANQEKSSMREPLKWKIENDNSNSNIPLRGGPFDPTKLVVELGPMEIRTFLISFE